MRRGAIIKRLILAALFGSVFWFFMHNVAIGAAMALVFFLGSLEEARRKGYRGEAPSRRPRRET